jgi:hypothetical protein
MSTSVNFDLDVFEAMSPEEQRRHSDECRRRRNRISRQRRRKAKAQFRCPFSGRFEKPLPSGVLIDDQLRQTALHEAAHVMVGCLLGPDPLRGVTIVPKGNTLGEAFFKSRRIGRTNIALWQAAYRKRIMVSLAGPIADFATGRVVHYMGDTPTVAGKLSMLRSEHRCPIVTGFWLERLDKAYQQMKQAVLDVVQREMGVDGRERVLTFSKLVYLAIIGFAASDANWADAIAIEFPSGLRTDP